MILIDLQTLATKLETSTPEELFGVLRGDRLSKLTMLKQEFRRCALLTHEDRHLEVDKPLARRAFIRLKELYTQAVMRVEANTYGTRVALATVKTKHAEYQILKGLTSGDLATLYVAVGKHNASVLLKIARDARDNDLLQREHDVLTALHKRIVEAGLKSIGDFLLKPIESAVVRIKNQDRRVNVFEQTKDVLIPLTELASYFPNGVEQAHFVWIFRRLLTTLGSMHSFGVVHGAVLPTHVLINPKTHGIKLIDWCYSGPINEPIRAISTGYKDWYPPEVLSIQPATAATDIFMAAKTMNYILADHAHLVFQRFLETCLWPNPNRRPQDAWELYDNFSKIAKSIFGPRKFVPLVLPTT